MPPLVGHDHTDHRNAEILGEGGKECLVVEHDEVAVGAIEGVLLHVGVVAVERAPGRERPVVVGSMAVHATGERSVLVVVGAWVRIRPEVLDAPDGVDQKGVTIIRRSIVAAGGS